MCKLFPMGCNPWWKIEDTEISASLNPLHPLQKKRKMQSPLLQSNPILCLCYFCRVSQAYQFAFLGLCIWLKRAGVASDGLRGGKVG